VLKLIAILKAIEQTVKETNRKVEHSASAEWV